MKIICIPGLGGHKNVFRRYEEEFGGYGMEFVNLIDWPKTQQEVNKMVEEADQVIFLCNCYGAQIALRAMYRYPFKIKGLIVTEPFFAEMVFWREIARIATEILQAIKKVTDFFGLRRRNFWPVEYQKVELYPVFIQPYFDMKHQSITDYLAKIHDILSFTLPPKVDVSTLFIFSPKGFTRDPKKKEYLKKIFTHVDMIEMGAQSHNIATISRHEIAEIIKKWIKEKVSTV